LIENDEVSVLWPFNRPGHGWATIDTAGVNEELGWARYGLCKQFRFPEPNSIGLGVLDVRAVGAAELIRQRNEAIVSRLEVAPIGGDLLEEPAA